jgi:hypothetical protein
MKNDFWQALISGMTPDKQKDIHLWWQIPLLVILMMIFSAAAW